MNDVTLVENSETLAHRLAYFEDDFLRDRSATISTFLDVVVHQVTLGCVLHQYAEVPRVEFILLEKTVIELDEVFAGEVFEEKCFLHHVLSLLICYLLTHEHFL